MASDTDLAWAAGFFDGEGCFSTVCPSYIVSDGTKVNRRYLRLAVSQKEDDLLWKMKNILCEGNVNNYNSRQRPESKYQATGRGAFRAATALWPYLGERKRADFKRALKMIRESRPEGGERHRALQAQIV